MSAFLSCLYLSIGSAYMLPTASPQAHGFTYWRYDITHVVDPYGVAELGCSLDFKRFTVELAARHDSSLAAPDYGQNTIEARVRFYPWR